MATENLPAIAQARLPYHPALKERYDIDAGQWRVLVEAIFPAAQSIEAVVTALAYCKARKLDVMKRQCHIVPIWDKERRCYIETVWPSISELRTTAFRTGSYAGTDPTTWGEDVVKMWGSGENSCEVTFPEWAQVTVYRLVAGERCAFPGPRVYWMETFAKGKGTGPNAMWCKRPRGQLEKCALAAALRNAFPEEIGGEICSDEAEGIEFHSDRHSIAPPSTTPAPQLSKADRLAASLPPPESSAPLNTTSQPVTEGAVDANREPPVAAPSPAATVQSCLAAIAAATTIEAVRAAVREGDQRQVDLTPEGRERIMVAGLKREEQINAANRGPAPNPTVAALAAAVQQVDPAGTHGTVTASSPAGGTPTPPPSSPPPRFKWKTATPEARTQFTLGQIKLVDRIADPTQGLARLAKIGKGIKEAEVGPGYGAIMAAITAAEQAFLQTEDAGVPFAEETADVNIESLKMLLSEVRDIGRLDELEQSWRDPVNNYSADTMTAGLAEIAKARTHLAKG